MRSIDDAQSGSADGTVGARGPDDDLGRLLAKAKQQWEGMSEFERAEMIRLQSESWCRAEMSWAKAAPRRATPRGRWRMRSSAADTIGAEPAPPA